MANSSLADIHNSSGNSPPMNPEGERLLALMESFNMGMGMLDEEFEIIHCNQSLIDLLGSTSATVLGSGGNLRSIINAERWQELHQHMTRRNHWNRLLPELGNGVKIGITKLDAESGDITFFPPNARYVLVVSDRQDLSVQKAEVSRLEKLVEKTESERTQLVSQMGHELRTPLNAVLGFSQLLQAGQGFSQEENDYINEIVSASNYVLKLIDKILTVSKSEHECSEIKPLSEAIVTGDLVSECVALVEPLAQKSNIQMLHSDSNTVLVNDRVRLKQVLLNLLSNAIKYNEPGGQIVVRSFPSDGKVVCIEVQDSGKGISNQHLESIFTPFERLGVEGAQIEGSGIGLMITRRLTGILGGQISVVSEPGNGSVFSLKFPVNPIRTTDSQSSSKNVCKKLLWIGEPSTSMRFAERLTALRPELEFHYLEGFSATNETAVEKQADYVFIQADFLTRPVVDISFETKIALQKIPVVVVATSRMAVKLPAIQDWNIQSVLETPFRPTTYLKIIDTLLS